MWIEAQSGTLYNTAHLVSMSVTKHMDNQWTLGAITIADSQFVVLATFSSEHEARAVLKSIKKRLPPGSVIEVTSLQHRLPHDQDI